MSLGGILAVLCGCFASAHLTETRDYCQFESFNASCAPANQVIVMEAAQYGRMAVGRCMSRDYGYLGCAANVLDLLDRACSGQSRCELSVPTLRELVQPCPRDLTAYLQASYHCVTVLQPSSTRCNETVPVGIFNSGPSSVYVSANQNEPHAGSAWDRSGQPAGGTLPGGSGSPPALPVCGMVLRAGQGQRLNLTLYNLGRRVVTGEEHEQHSATSTGSCSMTLHLLEGASRLSAPLCPAVPKSRERHLLITRGNEASIYFSPSPSSLIPAPLLANPAHSPASHASSTVLRYTLQSPWAATTMTSFIKIEAVGCADLLAPPGAWMDRSEDRLVVRCNMTQETWYLTCRGDTWVGSVANCTQGGVTANETAAKRAALPPGLIVAIIIGIALGILFGIAMLISVFICRRRRHQLRNKPKSNSLLRHYDVTQLENEANAAIGCSLNGSRRVDADCADASCLQPSRQQHVQLYGRTCFLHSPQLQPLYSPDYTRMRELTRGRSMHPTTFSPSTPFLPQCPALNKTLTKYSLSQSSVCNTGMVLRDSAAVDRVGLTYDCCGQRCAPSEKKQINDMVNMYPSDRGTEYHGLGTSRQSRVENKPPPTALSDDLAWTRDESGVESSAQILPGLDHHGTGTLVITRTQENLATPFFAEVGGRRTREGVSGGREGGNSGKVQPDIVRNKNIHRS